MSKRGFAAFFFVTNVAIFEHIERASVIASCAISANYFCCASCW